jgi:hypothetical protein
LRPGVRRAIYILVLLMLALGAGFVGLLFWIKPLPNPEFIPLWVTQYRSGHIPLPAQTARDRLALHRGNYFPRWTEEAPAGGERHALVRDLLALDRIGSRDSVVVYLSARATRDAKGQVIVLPADMDPDQPQTGLPLSKVLEALGNCPARHRLLVLDIMRPVADARLGALADDVAEGVEKEVQAAADPGLLVLCACSAGQVSLASEALGRSVFGYYLEEGLRGWADGHGETGKRDGHISARELATFVRARVDRWAVRNRETRQTPVLFGSAPDFLLCSLEKARPEGHVAEPDLPKYPKSLLIAWKKHDQLWQDGAYRLAPHQFRQAQALLLRAESAWRGGEALGTVESEQLAAFETVLGEIAKARTVPRPEPQSLALAADFGETADPVMDKGLRALQAKLKGAARDPKTGEPREHLELASAFATQIEGLPAFARARPVFEAVTAEERPTRETLLPLEAVLRHRTELQPRYVETLVLRRLAELAAQAGDSPWPTQTVRRLLEVTRKGERAAAQPRAFAWNADLLERAAQARHEGEVLFWARGYGSVADADRLFQQADGLYQTALTQADLVHRGLEALDEAMAFLPAYVPYLDRAPQQQKTWEDAVLAARDLYPLLRPPGQEAPGDLTVIQDRTEALRRSLRLLHEPFAAEQLERLARRSRLPRPELSVLAEIDALLRTPFVPAEHRAALWQGARELERRVHRRTVDLDRDDDQLQQATAAEPDVDRERARQRVDEGANRRAEASLALLELAGLSPARLRPLRDGLTGARRAAKEKGRADWHPLGQALRLAWARQLAAQIEADPAPAAQDRLSRLLGPLDRVRALDEQEHTPAVRLLRQQEAALLGWLADRYRYQARDYREARLDGALASAERFYDQAARAYRAELPPQPYAELSGGPPLERLTPNRPRGEYRVQVRLHGTAKSAGPLPFAVLLPDSAWLKVSPDAASLKPARAKDDSAGVRAAEVPLDVELKAGAEAARVPPPRGFLVQARVGDRAFHSRVDVPLYATADRLELLLSTDPDVAEPPLGEIRLRPGKVRQAFYVHLRNHTDKPRKVIVEVKSGDPLVEPVAVALVAPKRDTVRVPLGKPLEKLPAELPEFQGPLTLRLLDADTRELLDERAYRVDVANPREYVRLSGARFTPGDGANKYSNTLAVQLAVTAPPGGPKIPAELVLPPEHIPGLLSAKAGVFRGTLPSTGVPEPEPLTLFASKLELAQGAEEDGAAYVHVDGYERAFVLRTTFARRGDPTTPRTESRPAVRVRTAHFLRGGTDTGVALEVDNAPDGATVEFTLGQLRGGRFVPDLPPLKLPEGRRRQIGLTPFGPGGGLLFEASVKDWVVPLDTSKILGRRDLRVRLLNADGREIARALERVTVSDSGPDRVRLIEVPRKAQRGTELVLKAVGRDDEAGIKEVLFFVGRPVDKKLPPNTTPVPGQALDAGRTTWAGKLPLPADRKGPTDVSVQFINRAGLSTFDTATLELTETDPAKTGPGKIRGRVLEGPRPQSGLHVVLTDEKNKEKTRTKTAEDGTFEFPAVEPGRYRVWAFKPESQRRGMQPAVVEANKTTNVQIPLSIAP